jgi:homoserine O-succinyltransferase/O-acetyltransferase
MFRHAARTNHRSSRSPLVIGLVNNMPDLALRATERQFCALLSAASRDFVVRLKLFTLPDIPRSDATLAHIARYYDDIAELTEDPPDGLIVTGTEPRVRNLKEEPYWHALSYLASWAEDKAVPSVWSCLSAHAAVLQLDGIERHPLGPKLSGVFDCHINSASHEVVRGTPAKWRVPHSRLYGLSEDALLSHGYSVVSWSPDAGADIFVKQGDTVALFFQGHPEYSSSALLGEYRRDINRFLSGELESYPGIPRSYFSASVEVELGKFRERALSNRSPDLAKDFAQLVTRSALHDPWFSTAVRIYENWLSLLIDRRIRHPSLPAFSKFETESPRRVA